MNFIEYPVGGKTIGTIDNNIGSFRHFRSPFLTEIVDSIWDLDIPDSDAAKTLAIKLAPSPSLLLMAQYRTPAAVRQGNQDFPSKCAIQIQTSSVALQPTGALGVIIVFLKPDAANRIVEAPLGQFAKATVHLGNVFRRGDVMMCSELLVGARNSAERIATVEAFLLRLVRPRPDGVAYIAASQLRTDPNLTLHRLAVMLNVSVRQLSRTFNATFDMPPKRFARLARFEMIVAERRKSLSWAEIASACGFSDQTHLVREFRDIAGEAPTEFFAQEMVTGVTLRDSNFIIQRAVDHASGLPRIKGRTT
jgi:AraC-like DNA-binding protein